MSRAPSLSTLFPYTTLFRSSWRPVESRYPLALISPASDRRITSTFGGLHVADGPPPLEMHPERRSEEHTSELQSHSELVCRLLLDNKQFPLLRRHPIANMNR